MIKNNITIWILLGAFSLFSCNNTEKPALVFKYYDNEKVEQIISGLDTLNSDRIYFYKTGDFFGFEKYKNGKKHGEVSFFYKSGRIKSRWIWYEGHPDGYCYNYGDTYDGYPMEFLVYGGHGQLVLRKKYDETGKLTSAEGEIPKGWNK